MKAQYVLAILVLTFAFSAGDPVLPGSAGLCVPAHAQAAPPKPPAGTDEALARARDQIKTGRFDQAVATLRPVIANETMPPPYMAVAFLLRGAAHQGQQKDKAALADFHNALWLDALPVQLKAQTHFLRARSLLMLGRADEAMADASTAVELDPDAKQYAELREAIARHGGAPGGVTASIAAREATRDLDGSGVAQPDGLSGPFAVQLGAMASEAAARREWERIRKAHGDLAEGLVAEFQPTGSPEDLVRLRAGPADSWQSAERLCGQFKERGQACFPVRR